MVATQLFKPSAFNLIALLNVWEESISDESCKFKIMNFLSYFKFGATAFGSYKLYL